MYGAILGDIIGSPYEFDRGDKTTKFPLFNKESCHTDDTVMTIAVADALMSCYKRTDDEIKHELVKSMQKWGKKYPNAGYGQMFYQWLRIKDPQPYGSFGNGSAMRVSSVGWLYNSLEETRKIARLTAEVSHNHPEGIKGAEATASAIWMARCGYSKTSIGDYIIDEFDYDLSRTCDELRPLHEHIETCQDSMPKALAAFFEGENFEDVIRLAISLGGDTDTIACIAGSIAEAYYGIPQEIIDEAKKLGLIPRDMLAILDRFDRRLTCLEVCDADN